MDNSTDLDNIEKLMHTKNNNNGLLTKIWGPPMWIALHSVAFGYPLAPTPIQKENYKNYFVNTGDVLPCRHCRDSYKIFISTEPTILNDSVMKNRITLTKWLFDIHNRVNEKLEVDYGVTFEDHVKRYESYRAKCGKREDKKPKGCTMPLDKKADSYKIAKIKDCPVITYELAKKFIPYAKKRKLNPNFFKFLDKIKRNRHRKDESWKTMWTKRNIYCQQLISDMRINGIPSLETDGEFKGLPTISELQLMMMICSNLCAKELQIIANNFNKITVYRLFYS